MRCSALRKNKSGRSPTAAPGGIALGTDRSVLTEGLFEKPPMMNAPVVRSFSMSSSGIVLLAAKEGVKP
jgi:hypothetical protein